MHKSFPSCGSVNLGLYPLVDSSAWIEKLLPLGINSIQLRLKNKSKAELETEIQKSILLAQKYQARLFINDHWQLAIRHGAYGVHLGQEDLATADLEQIHRAELRLGISTHSLREIDHSLRFKPSYLAFGPIFPTTSKIVPFAPQGTDELTYWAQKLTYPIVAIGGINLHTLPEIIKTGVNGIAVISAITQAQDPIKSTKEMLRIIKEHQRRDNH